ncbi:YolD-like family protein [Salinicoccus sp. ID82-1]|uniref:YolD-like family protein n=1 Tax=Salinicoccus sp. ID82-1 TaxID=2820269 RepID=UPI001F412B76|nr:YolD-like family protein [Salinicoccus sp. ID82-1]MCG1009208.1 YolD-like family protein [Salinicoccus sp. ID82-1]
MNTKVNQETDYRKIPVGQLDSNIPQGRGMIKWQPFATMPEQYERIARMIEDQAKCEPPSFDDETLVRLEEQIRRQIGEMVVLRYWSEGFEVQLECEINYIDNHSRTVVVLKNREVIAIQFAHIYEILFSPEYFE